MRSAPEGLPTLLALIVVALPQVAAARDAALCSDLYRRLNSMPQIIGSSSANGLDTRRYTADLSRLNADIRSLRIDLRRNGCGNGSIVSLGRARSEMCPQMQDTLRALEEEREALARERNNNRRLLQPSEERVALLSAIRQNDCADTEPNNGIVVEQKPDIRIEGIALPKEEDDPRSGPGRLQPQEQAGSSITRFGTASAPSAAAVAPVLPPDRPYDPTKKVRMVGPVFFPEDDIDLANPKLSGPQPQQ